MTDVICIIFQFCVINICFVHSQGHLAVITDIWPQLQTYGCSFNEQDQSEFMEFFFCCFPHFSVHRIHKLHMYCIYNTGSCWKAHVIKNLVYYLCFQSTFTFLCNVQKYASLKLHSNALTYLSSVCNYRCKINFT